ncbi:MAG TPA: signal peptidase II, partial [Rhizomicrobium sp.]
RRIAALCALAVALLNFPGEAMVLAHAGTGTLIPGLADFHPAWNRGVSFSLLTQDSATGRILLSLVLAAIVVLVAAMAWRTREKLAAAGYGLIVGGALANLSDRIRHGAVLDYLALHLGSVPLFVCNFADIAISAGVALVVLDGLIAGRARRDS